MRRGADRAGHQLTTTDGHGNSMGGSILVSDVRWLRKLLRKVIDHAEPAGKTDRVSVRLTTTELRRAERIANTLGWHEQHVAIGQRVGPEVAVAHGAEKRAK